MGGYVCGDWLFVVLLFDVIGVVNVLVFVVGGIVDGVGVVVVMVFGV